MRLFGRKLGSVQVEVSTHCQLNCLMCPKSIFRKDWIHEHMDLDTFRNVPFKLFRYAHLQGWGEPLLNPNIIEMIEIAKREGCSVGITTNGVLLQEFARELANAGIDLVAVSIASPKLEEHRKIRGCDLYEILEGIRLLSEYGIPKIVVTTVMMKNTVKNLPELIKIAKEYGVSEVIANNLDYVPSKDLEELKVFSHEEDRELTRILEDAKKVAKNSGVNVVVKPVKLEECLVCAENPIKNCLVTVDGRIAPCVYLHLPTKSDVIRRVFLGREITVPKVYFGNLRETEFKKIWNGRKYKEFRNVFVRRLSVVPGFDFEIPELPEVCKTCYKAYSV